MTHAEHFLASLEAVSAASDDPAPLVYARLFSERPELEAEFAMDTDGGVRGSMLQQSLECLIDLADGPGIRAASILSAEQANHDGYGLDRDVFTTFFETMRAAFRNLVADDWTPDMDAGWDWIVDRAVTLAREQP